MKHVLPCACATIFLCTGAWAADPTLSLDGYGSLKFGMPAERVLRLLQDEKPYNPAASDACEQFTLPQFRAMGLRFMLEKSKLVRIDVDFDAGAVETSAQTDKGIGLRAKEEDVLKAYPDAVIKPNPADPTWHTIVVQSPDRSRGIIFETNGKTVKSIRAGDTPVIAAAEGCN
ncbi:hypothetical protein [Rhizomicrobium electricum]|uniref:Secreted protein n=1 Tax=Rhizomicrobium electricum TaxID=480070 RepID=A0ABP3P1H9_9PROT|nr:hypothetical protein [Rhizomicrobium electricum]NIJ47552.1 hypothetical protein [Rhizomicrobium electricum]